MNISWNQNVQLLNKAESSSAQGQKYETATENRNHAQ